MLKSQHLRILMVILRTFGYLFITKDKKILLSGDTGISENLKKYGKN